MSDKFENEIIWDKFFGPLKPALSYDDVFIVPQYSEISSRKEVDVSTTINEKKVEVPIIVANMESVINTDVCSKAIDAGGIGALHRMQSIDEAVKEYLDVKNNTDKNVPIFVSIGVNRDTKERFQELYRNGAREFVIDIAHGHSKQMKKMIEWIKGNYLYTYLMCGNVATPKAIEDLVNWGANSCKIFVAPGQVCVTKNVTGCTVPTLSCAIECAKQKDILEYKLGKKICLVADGGAKEIGDVAKAIGAGCDLVMSGRFFSECVEAPGQGTYRGSASKEVQNKYRSDHEYVPTPEGKSIHVELTTDVKQIITDIAGGLKSSFSYVGARNMKEFHQKCRFGVHYNK